MSEITVTRTINAPLDFVFDTVSDIKSFSKAIEDIIHVEFLSNRQAGVGTKFRETRILNGREVSSDLEVIEFVENDHIRLVSEAGGTTWDSVFTVTQQNGDTLLKLQMEARPHKLMAKLATPMMKYFIKNALEKDMDAVKTYCEKSTPD